MAQASFTDSSERYSLVPLEETTGNSTYSTVVSTADRKDSFDEKIPVFVYVNAVSASLNALNVGFDIGLNTPAALLLQQDLKLSDFQLEWLLGCLNFFALWGALGSTYVVQRFGMRMSFVAASLLFLLGLILMISTWNSYFQLLFGRGLVGVGVGFGCAVTPQYLAETTPAKSRGFFTSWSEVGGNIGIVLGFSVGYIFRNSIPGRGWRLMFLSGCILPSLVIVLALVILVESPRWLIHRGRITEARYVLQRLISEPSSEDCSVLDDKDEHYDHVDQILRDIEQDVGREEEVHRREKSGLVWLLCEVKTRPVKRMLILGMGIAIAHELCGIDAIQYYLVCILKEAGVNSRDEQSMFLMALGGLKLAFLFVSSALMDVIGRRPLLIISVSGMILALAMISVEFFLLSGRVDKDQAPVTLDGNTLKPTDQKTIVKIVGGLAVYLSFFSLGLGPLGWILPAELFSTNIRSKAVALTTFSNRLTATFMTTTMLTFTNILGRAGYFCYLVCINVMILVLALRYLPETKDKSLEQITTFFHNNNNNNNNSSSNDR